MRARSVLLSLLLLWSVPAWGQDFGVMESAETINRGNFKLRVNPLILFGKDGGDNDAALAAIVGYGFTRRFDLEGGVAIADGVRILGATAEFSVRRDPAFNLSLIPGVHVRRGDRTLDTTGLDLIVLGSHRLTPRLDVYGALDLAFEDVSGDRFDDRDYRTAHLVPGLEYKVHQDLELLAEVGIALNDSARHYVTGGLAYYFR